MAHLEVCVSINRKNGKLGAVRKAKGLSVGQLSALSGIDARTLLQYENGARDLNAARLSVILKLSLALGCAMSDILTDGETLRLLDRLPPRQT